MDVSKRDVIRKVEKIQRQLSALRRELLDVCSVVAKARHLRNAAAHIDDSYRALDKHLDENPGGSQ